MDYVTAAVATICELISNNWYDFQRSLTLLSIFCTNCSNRVFSSNIIEKYSLEKNIWPIATCFLFDSFVFSPIQEIILQISAKRCDLLLRVLVTCMFALTINYITLNKCSGVALTSSLLMSKKIELKWDHAAFGMK